MPRRTVRSPHSVKFLPNLCVIRLQGFPIVFAQAAWKKTKRRQSHIFTHQNGFGVGRTLRPNRVRRLQFHVLSAPWRLCGRNWVWGWTAHSRLNLGSARRAAPTLGLSIRADSSFAGLSETAEDCRCYNSSSSWLRAFV